MSIDYKTIASISLAQNAAESYLTGVVGGSAELLARRLQLGSNNFTYWGDTDAIARTPNLPGKTRMTESQISDFVERYTVVDHLPNTITGFSATLFFDKIDNRYVLSFRSTEYPNEDSGGDWRRDGASGADNEVSQFGFAYAQIADMEAYYRRMVQPIVTGSKLVVSGYSLGGHLATVFAEAHYLDAGFDGAYTFNAPGRGALSRGDVRDVVNSAYQAMSAPGIDAVLRPGSGGENIYQDDNFYKRPGGVRDAINAASGFPSGVAMSGTAQSLAADKINQVYGLADFDDATWVANSGIHSNREVRLFIEDQPDVQGLGPVAALDGMLNIRSDFGTTHSITLLADTLAVAKALQSLQPTISEDTVRLVLSTASNQRGIGNLGGDGLAESDSLERVVESLAKIFGVDLIPLGATASTGDLPVSDEGGGFGNLSNRNAFYAALDALKAQIGSGEGYTFTPLARLTLTDILTAAKQDDATGLAYRYALVNGSSFVLIKDASLYAQHNVNGALALANDEGGQLTEQFLIDRAQWAERAVFYNEKNARYDTQRSPRNPSNKGDGVAANDLFDTENKVWDDRGTGTLIRRAPENGQTAYRLFGRAAPEFLAGNENVDHIYGRAGTDYLQGRGGDDYLEGGSGFDVYEYRGNGISAGTNGVGIDGSDTIFDTDGKGVLRYTYTTDQGRLRSTVIAEASIKVSETQWRSADEVFGYEKRGSDLVVTISGLDSGSITINNFRDGDYGIRLWQSANASSTTFTIAGDQAPKDFDAAPGIQTQTNELGNIIVDPATSEPDRADTLNDSSANDLITSLGGNDVITASRGGDDSISVGAGRDWVDAGNGNDLVEGGSGGTYADQIGGDALHGGAGDDRIYGDTEITLPDAIRNRNAGTRLAEIGDFVSGGAGDDRIIAGSADDLLSGGNGKDLIVAGAGNDDIWGDREQAAGLGWTAVRTAQKDDLQPSFKSEYTGVATYSDGTDGDADVIYGGAGADWISGEAGNDFIDGGPDNDVLYGMDGMDILIGADGDDWITGDFAVPQPGRPDASDYLDGGAGDDHLYGNGGDDILIGGPGNDILLGGEGKDIYVFAKGDGEDTIFDAPAGATDPNSSIVVLGDGISPSDVKFRKGSLMVDLGSQDPGNPTSPRDALHFEGFDALDPYSTPVIGELRFYDGTSMTYDEILAQGFDIDGTTGDDNGIAAVKLEGTAVADRIHGYEGHDVLVGLDGNDMLDGGPGNDRLDGGAGDDYLDGGAGIDDLSGGLGNDTYVFDPFDSVTDAVGSNTVAFGVGISPEDLRISQITVFGQPRLLLTQTGVTGAGMVLQNTSIAQQKFSYSFSDGTTLTQEQLAQIAYTTPQDLSGTSGDDMVVGYAGDDSLSGGLGNDRLSGRLRPEVSCPQHRRCHHQSTDLHHLRRQIGRCRHRCRRTRCRGLLLREGHLIPHHRQPGRLQCRRRPHHHPCHAAARG